MKSDGSILIDTRIDTKGIAKGTTQIESMLHKTLGTAKKVGMAIAAVFSIRQIVAFSKECIELGSALDEVQNVVDVTFGNMSSAVDEWAKSAATSFGESELAAKQYASTYGAMLKSMGVSGDKLYEMSTDLAGLAGDLASFYNLDTDEAFNKIRSGMAGITMPLQQLGINMSEVNLEQFRMNQGMTTAYKNMNQQQKALLRYQYLLHVTSDAQGDFARTSNSWANQTRILHLQFQSIKADLGKGFINLFTPILKAINTLLQGLAKLASAFKSFTALITGQKADTSTSAGGGVPEAIEAYEDGADAAQGYADATEQTAKATEKANKANKRYLSGLDEIRRFETTKTDTAAEKTPTTKANNKPAAQTNAGQIANINFGELAKGETVIDKTAEKMKAFFDMIKSGVQPTIDSLKRLWNEGLSALGNFAWQGLLDFYNSFLVPVGQWVFGEGIPRFVDALNNGLMQVNWGVINQGLDNLWQKLAPFAINVGEGLLWFWENVLVPLGVWHANEVVPRFLETVSHVIDIATGILDAARPGWEWFWENVLVPIAQWTGGVFTTVWDFINEKLEAFSQWCKENPGVIENITTFVSAFFTALAGIAVIAKVWTMIQTIKTFVTTLGTIAAGANPVVVAIAGLIALGVLLWKNWDEIKAKAAQIWQRIYGNVTTTWNNMKIRAAAVWDKISTFLSDTWTTISTTATDIWNTISTTLGDLWDGLTTKVTSLWDKAKTTLSTIWNGIKVKAIAAWNLIKDNIITPVQTMKETVQQKFEDLRKAIKSKWETIKKQAETWWGKIQTNIITPVTDIWTGVTDAANGMKDDFVAAWTALVELIKAPINGIITIINGMLSSINSMLDNLEKVLTFDISFTNPFTKKKVGFWYKASFPRIGYIPELAQGAVIPPNAPFLATLGDQKNGQNIEAPLDTIKEAVADVVGSGEIRNVIILDGKVVYDNVMKRARRQQQSSGANPFALA